MHSEGAKGGHNGHKARGAQRSQRRVLCVTLRVLRDRKNLEGKACSQKTNLHMEERAG